MGTCFSVWLALDFLLKCICYPCEARKRNDFFIRLVLGRFQSYGWLCLYMDVITWAHSLRSFTGKAPLTFAMQTYQSSAQHFNQIQHAFTQGLNLYFKLTFPATSKERKIIMAFKQRVHYIKLKYLTNLKIVYHPVGKSICSQWKTNRS